MNKKVQYDSMTACALLLEELTKPINSNTVIVCVGTPKCIGDSLGPIIGTILEMNFCPFPVYGTIDSPIHALNLEKRVNEINKIHPNACIIGIDAGLGDSDDIGQIHVRDFGFSPGEGVGKQLKTVGDISIIGVIGSTDFFVVPYLHSIELSFIYNMAKTISQSILHVCNIETDIINPRFEIAKSKLEKISTSIAI